MLIRKCVAKLNQKGASIKKTPSISIQDGEARKLETRLKTNKTHFAKGNTHATESTRRGQGLFERANIGHAGDFRGVCVGVDVDSDRRRTTEELQCCVPRQSRQQRETQERRAKLLILWGGNYQTICRQGGFTEAQTRRVGPRVA